MVMEREVMREGKERERVGARKVDPFFTYSFLLRDRIMVLVTGALFLKADINAKNGFYAVFPPRVWAGRASINPKK